MTDADQTHVTPRPPQPPPSPPRRPPAGWPDSLSYQPWKAWVIWGAAGLVVVTVVFSLGMWRGWRWAKAKESGPTAAQAVESGDKILYWTCSMHPQIKLPGPGQCPICLMDLTPVRAGDEENSNLPRLALSERARMLARVETSLVSLRPATHRIDMVGKITADETRITYISSYIPGRIDRLFVNYTGIQVRKGMHLAEIYSPELLVAQKEYLIALAAVEQARASGATTQSDAAPGPDGTAAPGMDHVPPSPVDETATALLESSRRKLALWGIPPDEIERLERERKASDHMRIDSPVEGWVLDRQGYEGMYVETGTRIFTLADLRSVWVLLDAYEIDIGYVRYGQRVEFETEAYPGETFEGRVSYVDPILNEPTRTVRVRVNVPNPEMKLRPGMFVRARLHVQIGEGGHVIDPSLAGEWMCPMHPEVVKSEPGTCDVCGMDLVPAESLGFATTQAGPADVLVVPATAVLLTGRRAVVYVETDDKEARHVYEGREVRLGPRVEGGYVVLDGLHEGERVVTHGAVEIDSALQIRARPSMMQPGPESEAAAATDRAPPAPVEASRAVAGAMYHAHVAPVIDGYLAHVAALAADDAPKAAAALAAMRKAIPGAAPHGLPDGDAERFKTLIDAIGAAILDGDTPTIEAMRNALPKLTAALEKYLRVFGHDRPDPMLRMHCPMAFDNKGADWFQNEEPLANPYFGASMLRCGEVTAEIGADGKEAD